MLGSEHERIHNESMANREGAQALLMLAKIVEEAEEDSDSE